MPFITALSPPRMKGATGDAGPLSMPNELLPLGLAFRRRLSNSRTAFYTPGVSESGNQQ